MEPVRIATSTAHFQLPEALSRQIVVAQAGSAIIAGGLRGDGTTTDRVFRLALSSGAVSRLAPLPQPLHDSAGIMLGGSLVVAGGGNSREVSAVEQLGPNRRWRSIGQLPQASSDLSMVAIPDGCLVIGGYDGARASREVLKSPDGTHFTTFARLSHAVRYAAAVQAAGAVWLFGGEDRQRELSVVQRIDLATGAVSESRLPQATGHAAAVTVGSRVLVMGGRTGPTAVTSTMWWFDPVTRRFSHAGRLPYPVADAGVLTTGSDSYLLGGETPDFTRSVIRVRQLR